MWTCHGLKPWPSAGSDIGLMIYDVSATIFIWRHIKLDIYFFIIVVLDYICVAKFFTYF